jgi:small GTP-binding protein
MSIVKEFHVAVLGAAEVGKTNLMSRLSGGTFNRKSSYKTSTQAEPAKTSLEVNTSAGLLLFHFYDWAWIQKKKELEPNEFNSHLSQGADGAIFMYSVISKESKKDFEFFNDWYERASGYDKPYLIISNKNDQKKRQVSEEEGKALANKGNKRAYVPISLVDDTGIEDILVTLGRLFMNDLNLTVSSSRVASEESMLWSANKRASLITSIHNEVAASNVDKTDRVLCLVPNADIFNKLLSSMATTCHFLHQLTCVDDVEEQLLAMQVSTAATIAPAEGDSAATAIPPPPVVHTSLPISVIIATPALNEMNQNLLKALAVRYNLPCVITVPRSMVGAIETAIGSSVKA